MLKVPGTKIAFRYDTEFGMQTTWDGGLMWHFTFRSESEIREMWSDVVGELIDTEDRGVLISFDEDREVFGDTLDEPIPEEFWEIISDT